MQHANGKLFWHNNRPQLTIVYGKGQERLSQYKRRPSATRKPPDELGPITVNEADWRPEQPFDF